MKRNKKNHSSTTNINLILHSNGNYLLEDKDLSYTRYIYITFRRAEKKIIFFFFNSPTTVARNCRSFPESFSGFSRFSIGRRFYKKTRPHRRCILLLSVGSIQRSRRDEFHEWWRTDALVRSEQYPASSCTRSLYEF